MQNQQGNNNNERIINSTNLSNNESGINNYDSERNYWNNQNQRNDGYSNPGGVTDNSLSNNGMYNSPQYGGYKYPSEMNQNLNNNISNQSNKVSIVAVHKNQAGIITDFKLSDGRILDKQQAVMVAETEGIDGVNVGRTRGKDHTKMLRANPTNDVSKALDNLPTF